MSDMEELGYWMAEELYMKGYCVVEDGLGFMAADIEAAVEEAKDKMEAKFETVPAELLDGILGAFGTGRVAELAPPTRASDDDGEKLRGLDKALADAVKGVAPYTQEFFELRVTGRTRGLLVEGGSPSGTSPELNEKVCNAWLNRLLRRRLMLLLFLGPSEGTLELQPLDEVSVAEELTTRSGMLVMLRADLIRARHFSSKDCYTLCTLALGPDCTRSHGARNELGGLAVVNDTVKELAEWAMSRVEQVKAKRLAELQEAGFLHSRDGLPRSWEHAMSHIFQAGTAVAIRGDSTKQPASHDPFTFWSIGTHGADLVCHVPPERWDHNLYYDPAPDSYKRSDYVYHTVTNIKHAGFMEGVNLFDHKLFNISVAESKGMDVQQRLVLETSYEALHRAGFRKKDLMNAYIGVFGGSTNPEWNLIPLEFGAQSGTGGSEAIFCNRVSFCLGMQGPSTTIDCEMASAAAATYVACAQVAPTNPKHEMSGLNTPASLASGGYCMVVPNHWARFNYWMNPVGRCLTFDAQAAGYVRGEAVGTFCIMPLYDTVDGQLMASEKPHIGVIAGYRMNNSGMNTSMQSPSAVQEQDIISQVLRQAGVGDLDVDAVECHGTGLLLHDAVEVAAASQALRGRRPGLGSVLMLGSAKASVGAQCEASAMAQMTRVLYSQRLGVNLPNLHLKALNPHTDFEEEGLQVTTQTEPMSYASRSSFHGVKSHGFGGTHVNLLFWNMASEQECRTTRPTFDRDSFCYWPSGGGSLDAEALPSVGYYLIGSWDDWQQPVHMVEEAYGCHVGVVTLGDQFLICLDGDFSRVLVPGSPGSQAVRGPVQDHKGYCWSVDSLPPDESDDAEISKLSDQYRVTLQVAGKWRTVGWEKLADARLAEE